MAATTVSIDISELADLIEEVGDELREDLGQAIRAHWVDLVEQEITSARRAEIYVEALSEPEVEGDSVSVTLHDEEHVSIAQIEDGARGYDGKAALLKGPNVKFAKDGTRYQDIPIESQDPRVVGARRPFPEQLLPAFRAAKSGETIVPRKQRGALGPFASMRKDPRKWKQTRRRQPDGGRAATGKWKVPPTRFQGAQFIRVSEASEGWYHPAVAGHHFGNRVEQALPEIVAAALAEYDSKVPSVMRKTLRAQAAVARRAKPRRR